MDFTCTTCTLIQSNSNNRCQICGAANPNSIQIRSNRWKHQYDEGMITCSNCQYINVGLDLEQCENCASSLSPLDIPAAPSIHLPFQSFLPNFDHQLSFDSNEEDDNEEEILSDDDGQDFKNKLISSNEDRRKKRCEPVENPMSDEEVKEFHLTYIKILVEQKHKGTTISDNELRDQLRKLFSALQYENAVAEGDLTFNHCQVCFEEENNLITMKGCSHKMICRTDFHQYLVSHISDGDLFPWIPCPGEICSVPCHVENIIQDGDLTRDQLFMFLTKFMLKKLSRNENFIICSNCSEGGFLQFGSARKQIVSCLICKSKQTIEKGFEGELDPIFKKMLEKGELRECPTCRHLTMKEKGLCNVIQCAKCGIWWNWRSKEQAHSEKQLKTRARMSGTLWEPGELEFQRNLERNNPEEFRALLERNGIKYNPNYVRGQWN